jgi:hypothetical protein
MAFIFNLLLIFLYVEKNLKKNKKMINVNEIEKETSSSFVAEYAIKNKKGINTTPIILLMINTIKLYDWAISALLKIQPINCVNKNLIK